MNTAEKSVEALYRAWQRCISGADASGSVRVEALGGLAVGRDVAVWHPLDDLYEAPRISFPAEPALYAVWRDREVAAFVLRSGSDDAARWSEVGDASTDTDRFFLVRGDQFAAVIDWMNEDVSGFEQLGSGDRAEAVEHDGARVTVIPSPDGNARVHAGHAADGGVVCALIEL